MTQLKYCVIIDDRIYCWDEQTQRFLEAEVVPKDKQERIPDEAIKLLIKKMGEDL